MIQSFADSDTEGVWRRRHVRRFGSDLQRLAHRTLLLLDAAESINDLRVPPGNRLEQLRVVDGARRPHPDRQLRICFVWAAAGPTQIEITDYH